MLAYLRADCVAPVQHVQDPMPQLTGDDWLVGAAEGTSAPSDIAAVQAAAQDVVDRCVAHGLPALAEGQAPVARELAQLFDRVPAGSAGLVHLPDQEGPLGQAG